MIGLVKELLYYEEFVVVCEPSKFLVQVVSFSFRHVVFPKFVIRLVISYTCWSMVGHGVIDVSSCGKNSLDSLNG